MQDTTMYTYTHTYTRTQTRTYTHTDMYTHRHARTEASKHTMSYQHKLFAINSQVQWKYGKTSQHEKLCTKFCVQIFYCMHTFAHTRIHIHTYMHTHVHTYMHTHVHTYAHTHTLNQILNKLHHSKTNVASDKCSTLQVHYHTIIRSTEQSYHMKPGYVFIKILKSNQKQSSEIQMVKNICKAEKM